MIKESAIEPEGAQKSVGKDDGLPGISERKSTQSGLHSLFGLPLTEQIEELMRLMLPPVEQAPAALHRAMHHAVFPGGKRVRPRLLLTVAAACAADQAAMELALRAAAAVELVHSGSLIHDDLPCFDDAPVRRGQPTVHRIYGEPLAVLAGDALLTRAFEVLAETPPKLARRALQIVRLLALSTGSREGIIGGQGLEQLGGLTDGLPVKSPELLERYHSMKTAALFRLSAEAGATAAGATDGPSWGEVGQALGLAFQLGDDLCDSCGSSALAEKPVGRDAVLGRPNAVAVCGEASARQSLDQLLDHALERARSLAANPAPMVELIESLRAHFSRVSQTA